MQDLQVKSSFQSRWLINLASYISWLYCFKRLASALLLYGCYKIKTHKEKLKMKKMLIAALMAGLIGGATMAADDAFARGGNGGGKGSGICKQTSSTQQTGIKKQLRDGSCLNADRAASANQAKKGNAYGPGDGTGNKGTGPKDGTGNGTKSTK